MNPQNCYTCFRPSFHASISASSEGPAEPAWFQCPLHGCVGSDEIDGEFECADCLDRGDHPTTIYAGGGIPPFLAYPPSSPQIIGDLFAAAWQMRNGRDLYDNLAENTSPDHARRQQPDMIEAGVTSCGLMLAS